MLYALEDGVKVRASPWAHAYCPECSGEVIAKCGEINIWHWAHKVGGDCETWNEPETQWHLAWKSHWPDSCIEIPIVKDGIRHRADILLPNGLVIELQHSPINPETIREREMFYQKMIWIFDVQEQYRQGALDGQLDLRDRGTHYTFRWRHPKKSLSFVERPSYWDVGYVHHKWKPGYKLLAVRKIHTSGHFAGWGILLDKQSFILSPALRESLVER